MKQPRIIPNITFKSKIAHIKNLKLRNKRFKELSKEGKRLEIAWDALNLILAKKIEPAGGYGEGSTYWGEGIEDVVTNAIIKGKNSAEYFQERLVNKLPVCECCQRGICMISQIRLGNQLKPGKDNIERGTERIIKGFDIYDFEAMEREYEHSAYNHPHNNNSLEKMANILCNVLINGNFNRDDRTNYLIIK